MGLAEFWQATPRETWLAVKAYRRRRGWMAWHGAVLSRIEGRDIPALAVLCDEELPNRKPQDPEDMLKAVRSFKAMLAGKKETPA